MTPDVVVDIGNSRMKWGLVAGGRVAEMISLPLDDPGAWVRQLSSWGLNHPVRWAMASVNPATTTRFEGFTAAAGDKMLMIRDYRSLPLRVDVDEPSKVGIDRLLGAVAAKSMTHPGEPIVTVDVGTAVTVNCIDAAGTFVGGAIFPGPRSMASALRQGTAALPDAGMHERVLSELPGRNTVEAIRSGIVAAVTGGVEVLVTHLAISHPDPWLYFTGGGRDWVTNHLIRGCSEVKVVPHLNLEGIRLAAEALS